MNGSIFKRRLPSGTITWVYKFDAGRDPNGKRLYSFQVGIRNEGRRIGGDAQGDHRIREDPRQDQQAPRNPRHRHLGL